MVESWAELVRNQLRNGGNWAEERAGRGAGQRTRSRCLSHQSTHEAIAFFCSPRKVEMPMAESFEVASPRLATLVVSGAAASEVVAAAAAAWDEEAHAASAAALDEEAHAASADDLDEEAHAASAEDLEAAAGRKKGQRSNET